jgi:hypothetical protein
VEVLVDNFTTLKDTVPTSAPIVLVFSMHYLCVTYAPSVSVPVIAVVVRRRTWSRAMRKASTKTGRFSHGKK